MSIFNTIKEKFLRSAEMSGRIRARRELLNMSDRQLADFGFSKAQLLEGVSAWPWRTDTTTEVTAPLSFAKVGTIKHDKRAVKEAITELSAYSDRELAELGVVRHSIEEAVRFGRPAVEGVFDNHKSAA